MNKNLESVERVIGDKADEARLALYGSSLGVLGGGVEVVGLALKHGATQVQKARLSARGAEAGKATVRIGSLLARSGATISAVAGLYDATQAGMAANRSWKAGDTPAAVAYVFSTMFAGGSAVVGAAASIAGASSLVGPLGIAILLGLVAYGLFKWAEGEESTPLERWARRSYFGFGDEKPPIQWKRPEQAYIALSELNAATLGVEAGINFRMRIAGAGSHGLGGPMGSVGAPTYEPHLEYHLRLPYFDTDRSAYRWNLTIHRRGDGPSSQYIRGEVVAEGSLNPQTRETAASEHHSALAAPNPPKFPDFRPESATPTVTVRTVEFDNGLSMQFKDIKGAIVLVPNINESSIQAATLYVTYWPDRDVPDAYAELILMVEQ
jgi:hypothetical protein